MEALGLLEECQNIFEKGHKSWSSYFSKWETLAGFEEDLSEGEITIEESVPKKQKKKPGQLKKNKAVKKKVIRRKKVEGKNKNKTEGKVIERSRESGNENLPEERDNNQLEMHLRTIFMDILKANKNKWEIFAVLSQTFSHGDVAIKDSHLLQPNHQLALPPKQDEKNLLFRKVEVFSTLGGTSLFGGIGNLQKIELCESSASPAMDIRTNQMFNCIAPQNGNTIARKLKLCMSNKGHLPEGTLTPHNVAKVIFEFKSCPPSLPYRFHDEKVKLQPPALGFRHDSTPKSCKKTNNEYLCERNIPEMSITREEKRFGSLCLHKRTNYVGLNMENSNFVTPGRNSSERKCFSENISQRKRRRPTKLFFDISDSSDSENDERSQSSTPRIGWKNKSRKIAVATEVVNVEPDSDECDSIFDRVKKV